MRSKNARPYGLDETEATLSSRSIPFTLERLEEALQPSTQYPILYFKCFSISSPTVPETTDVGASGGDECLQVRIGQPHRLPRPRRLPALERRAATNAAKPE